MSSFPAFRSTPRLNAQIRLIPLGAAYAAILIGVPALAAINVAALDLIFDSLWKHHGLSSLIEPIRMFNIGLMFSVLFAWSGALLSVPIVWAALRFGFFGWASAILTGLALFQINWELFIKHGNDEPAIWLIGTLGSALLGLTFWTTAWILKR